MGVARKNTPFILDSHDKRHIRLLDGINVGVEKYIGKGRGREILCQGPKKRKSVGERTPASRVGGQKFSQNTENEGRGKVIDQRTRGLKKKTGGIQSMEILDGFVLGPWGGSVYDGKEERRSMAKRGEGKIRSVKLRRERVQSLRRGEGKGSTLESEGEVYQHWAETRIARWL